MCWYHELGDEPISRWSKVRRRLLAGSHDRSIPFDDLCGYLVHLGFELRVRGDHWIYAHPKVEEIVNVQPAGGGQAKPYRVRQVRSIVQRYGRGGEDDEV